MNAVLKGAKGGGNQPHQSTEAPDSLHSIARARILDLVSEGQILGFRHGGVNPLQDVYLNETPVANADGSLNFSDVYIDSRSGTSTQAFMPGFPAIENEFGVGTELKSSAPWAQAINNLDLTAVRIRISVPALQQSNSSTGDITGYYIAYKIELSTDSGAFVQKVTSAFGGKTTSKYERTHRIDLPEATTGWTVRVTRLTANKNLATIADTTTIESYTEIIDAKMRYPNSALVGIIIDAQQFSNIPTRAYDLYGRIVSVPSNYNPTTRTYTGVWDGSFKPAWTNNPAWIFYDLATNARYGLGRYVTAALMNKWNLYSIAQYCDQLVPDGRGGQEPRFTCSLYMQTQADAYKVLNDLASVFRGQMYWAGGAIQAVADMPGDPDYTYSPANVVGGQFQYAGSGRKTRYTVAQVSWNDPDDFGRAKVETVIDRDGLKRYGFQPTPLIAVGCTSKGQAQRLGLWALYTARLETETVVFKVGADGVVANPGRIIRVLDPVRAGKRQAGRVSTPVTFTALRTSLTAAAGDTVVPLVDTDGRKVTSGAVVTELRRTDWRGTVVLAKTARTNYAANSNDLTAWGGLLGATAGAGVAAPSGSGTMTRLTVTSAGSTVARTQEDTGVAVGQQFTASIYVRRDQHTYARFYGFGNGSNGVVFNLQTGVATIIDAWDAAGIEIIDANLARIWATVTPVSSGVWNVGLAPPAGGTFAGGEYLDFWGAQTEPGAAMTALIATGAAAKTVTDYSVTSGKNVTLGEAADGVAAYDWSGTGTVGTSTTTAVVVDQMPDLVAIGDSLSCTTSDAITETRVISAIDGPSRTITVSAAFSEVPAAETMWAVESTTLAAATYRVLSVAEPSSTDQAIEYTITALRHNESKFAAVDIGAAIEEPPITTIPSPTQQAPSTVVISAAATKGAVLSAILLTIQWTPAVGAVKYRVEWRRGNGNWNRLPLQAHLSVDLPSAKPGDYEARVYAIGPGGNGSQATYAAPFTVIDPTDLPDSIAEIQTQANDAKTDSANALQQLAYIASDSELSQGEKPLAIREYSDIIAEQALLDNEADEWNVTTAQADYDNAVAALTTYLNGLNTPTAWNNLGGDTDIVGTTWRSKWSAVYSKRRSLLNAILAVSKAENQPGGNLCKTSTYWNGAGSWCTTSRSVDGVVPNYLGDGYMDAKYTGTNDGGTNFDMWERGTTVPCKPGQIFYVSCRLSTYYGAAGGFGVIFLDKAGSIIAYVQANSKGAASASTFMYGLCTAPSTAVYARPWVFQTAPSVGDRIRWSEFEMRNDAFFQPGGGARIADARNLQAIIFANYASGWSGLSFSTSSTSTSCTISASAATLRAGSVSLAYSASSTTVSGSAGVTRTYYLYYDDGNFDGGAQALHATTSLITALSNDYRVLLGSITVTFPTSGTSTGGGGGPCPHEDAWVLMADPAQILPDWYERAKNVRPGDYLRLTDGRAGLVTHSERRRFDCVRVHTANGTLTCSTVAPLELVPNDELGIAPGASSLAYMAKNRVVRSLLDGAEDGAQVTRIEPIGEGWVQHITCQDAFFWTGDDQHFLLAHHNLKPLNP